MILGQRFLQQTQNEEFRIVLERVMKEKPNASASSIVVEANRYLVEGKIRDSMQVQPGITVMHQGMAGKLTTSMDGTPGIMSRNHLTNAVASSENNIFKRLDVQ